MVRRVLLEQNYGVELAPAATFSLSAAASSDLIVVVSPDFELRAGPIIRRIRARTGAPIVLVTAERTSKLMPALLSGADEYIHAPAECEELIERIAAVLRRARPGCPAEDTGFGPYDPPS